MNRSLLFAACLLLAPLGCQETRVVRDDSASSRFVNLFNNGRPSGDGGGAFAVQRGGQQQPKRTAHRDDSPGLPSSYWQNWGITTSFQTDQPATQPAEQGSAPTQATPWGMAPATPGLGR
jgi:hypothetical protein